MIYINTYHEYYYCKNRGFEPLIDLRFNIDIRIRVEIQNKLFGMPDIGKKNIPEANQKFYYWIWNHKQHICEETMIPLQTYSAKFISHILTKGAYPEMAHDPRNVNILNYPSHMKWENEYERRKMRIYPANKRTISILLNDYQKLR